MDPTGDLGLPFAAPKTMPTGEFGMDACLTGDVGMLPLVKDPALALEPTDGILSGAVGQAIALAESSETSSLGAEPSSNVATDTLTCDVAVLAFLTTPALALEPTDATESGAVGQVLPVVEILAALAVNIMAPLRDDMGELALETVPGLALESAGGFHSAVAGQLVVEDKPLEPSVNPVF